MRHCCVRGSQQQAVSQVMMRVLGLCDYKSIAQKWGTGTGEKYQWIGQTVLNILSSSILHTKNGWNFFGRDGKCM